MKEYYRKTVDEILKEFNTSLNGLDSKEIKNIQKIYGRNELKESGKKSKFSIFVDQFKNVMIILLIVCFVILKHQLERSR